MSQEKLKKNTKKISNKFRVNMLRGIDVVIQGSNKIVSVKPT